MDFRKFLKYQFANEVKQAMLSGDIEAFQTLYQKYPRIIKTFPYNDEWLKAWVLDCVDRTGSDDIYSKIISRYEADQIENALREPTLLYFACQNASNITTEMFELILTLCLDQVSKDALQILKKQEPDAGCEEKIKLIERWVPRENLPAQRCRL